MAPANRAFTSSPATRGSARGRDLSEQADAGPGDFIFVPAWALHQEINLSRTEPVVAIVCRTVAADELVYNEGAEG